MTSAPKPVTNANASRTPRWAWVLLAVLTLTACAARFIGIGSLLPHAPDADPVIIWQASYLDRPEGEGMTPRSYPATYYPWVLAYVVAAAPGDSHFAPAPRDASDEALRDGASEPYRKARTVIVLLSTLIIPFAFLVARRFFDPGWALCTSAFVATSLLATEYARQARPHAPSAAMSLLAVCAALALLSRPSMRNYVLAGLASALAVGTLHNGVFTLPALVLAHLLTRERRWVGLFTALVLVAAAVVLFYPWLWRVGIFAPGNSDRLDIGGQALGAEHFNGAGFYEIVRGLFGLDPVHVAIAGVGLAISIALTVMPATRPRGDKRKQFLVLLAFPMSFTFMWGVMSRVEPRFVVSLVPYVALLATLALRSIALRLAWGRAVSIGMVLATLALPTYACARHFRLALTPDTWTLAARWIEQNTDREKDRIGLQYLHSLPLRERRAGLEALPSYARNNWESYQLSLDPSADGGWNTTWMFRPGMLADRLLSAEEAVTAAREDDVKYAVVAVPLDLTTALDQSYEGISRAGELVIRIDPSRPQLTGGGVDRQWRAFEFTMGAGRLGPLIEIYRLKN